MAKTKELTVALGGKVTQNYQSREFQFSETVILDKGDDPEKVIEDLKRRIKDRCADQCREFWDALNKEK